MTLLSEITSAGPERQAELIERVWLMLNPEPRQFTGFPWLVPTKEYLAWDRRERRIRFLLRCGAYESAVIWMVPEGCRVEMLRDENGRGAAIIWLPGEIKPEWGDFYATPALALLSALVAAEGIA